MEDTLLFIPPCCVNKKLPRAIMQPPGRSLVFYTHADVTVEQFYRAIAYLVTGSQTLALSMSVANADMIYFLAQCFERGWVKFLVLSTARDCSALVERYLSDYKNRMLYACDKEISDVSSHMIIYSRDNALVLNGPMYDRSGNGISLASYTSAFYPSYSLFGKNLDWGHPLRNVLLPDVLRHRKMMMKNTMRIKYVELEHFLHMEFPPYKDSEQ